MIRTLTFGAILLGFATASPLERRYAVKERHSVPSTFTRIGDAPESRHVLLSVGLTQARFSELEQQLFEVSDPDHARYGQHLSQDEVNDLISPSEEALLLVHEWLHEHNIDPASISYSPARDFLSFSLPIVDVESLLDTKFSTYRHADGSELVRTHEWSLPLHLHDHIAAIQPTTSFLRPRGQVVLSPRSAKQVFGEAVVQLAEGEAPTVAKVCNGSFVTPQCIRTLYETINYKPQAGTKNQAAVGEFDGEVVNRSDTRIFLEAVRPEAAGAAATYNLVSIANGTVSQAHDTPKQQKAGLGIEGDLDIQAIIGNSWPVQATVYSTGGVPPEQSPKDGNEPYLTLLQYLLKQKFIPQVLSISYEDGEDTVPLSYARAVCSQFAQLGARGVSVFFSSGDGGVGEKCKLNGTKKFETGFPSDCPYITSVGATQGFSPEIVADYNFVSGGGFSNVFARPSYQDAAVSAYLKKLGNKYEGFYNKSGRAYPDMAAIGVNITIAWNGTVSNIGGGTSASAPIAASVFTLVNDALISHGKPPMGFLNPWLYKKGHAAFSDVTIGSAVGCGTKGFPAVQGWDAVTGWGTPRFEKILAAVGLNGSVAGWY